jgi:ATP sulfurylase
LHTDLKEDFDVKNWLKVVVFQSLDIHNRAGEEMERMSIA